MATRAGWTGQYQGQYSMSRRGCGAVACQTASKTRARISTGSRAMVAGGWGADGGAGGAGEPAPPPEQPAASISLAWLSEEQTKLLEEAIAQAAAAAQAQAEAEAALEEEDLPVFGVIPHLIKFERAFGTLPDDLTEYAEALAGVLDGVRA